jgi:hypothetical protein
LAAFQWPHAGQAAIIELSPAKCHGYWISPFRSGHDDARLNLPAELDLGDAQSCLGNGVVKRGVDDLERDTLQLGSVANIRQGKKQVCAGRNSGGDCLELFLERDGLKAKRPCRLRIM